MHPPKNEQHVRRLKLEIFLTKFRQRSEKAQCPFNFISSKMTSTIKVSQSNSIFQEINIKIFLMFINKNP